jgi:hypothetical protein
MSDWVFLFRNQEYVVPDEIVSTARHLAYDADPRRHWSRRAPTLWDVLCLWLLGDEEVVVVREGYESG